MVAVGDSEFEVHCHIYTPPVRRVAHLFALWRNARIFNSCSKINTAHCSGAWKVSSGKATWFRRLWYVRNKGRVVCDIQIGIGSVYLGKDIMTERDVALKLEVAQDSSSRLKHEYSVYQAISGLPRISKVYWYGKEGPYRVIVLDRLGKTLEEIVRTSMLDNHAVFTYAMQMVFLILPYNLCTYVYVYPSFRSLSHCTIDITFISTSNLTISY